MAGKKDNTQENLESLDSWYNDIMSKTITDNEKNRIQKEYDKRKEKGKGKPLAWIPSAEESSAKMQQSNPEFNRMINEKTSQARRSASSTSKVAEGLAREGALVSALNGDTETAKELGKTANQVSKVSKELITDKVNDGINTETKSESTSVPKVKGDNDYTLDDVLALNDNDPTKVQEWFDSHPDYEWGEKTKKWAEKNGVVNNNSKKEEIKTSVETTDNIKTSFKDLEKGAKDVQDKEAYSDAQVYENVADALNKDETDYEDMNKIVELFNEKASNIDDYYKENLPKAVWDMYKDGDITKQQLGYFILNGLGTGLINSSLIARGSSPTMESDLAKVRREKLEGALDRYNKKRDETMTTTLEQMGLNAELLNKFNIDKDTLKNNKIFDEVSKSRDRKNIERTLKAYKLAGEYLEGLTDEQKSNVFMAIMAMNSNDGKSAGISYLTSTVGKPFADKIMEIFGSE